jgi:hypothetical protein
VSDNDAKNGYAVRAVRGAANDMIMAFDLDGETGANL